MNIGMAKLDFEVMITNHVKIQHQYQLRLTINVALIIDFGQLFFLI